MKNKTFFAVIVVLFFISCGDKIAQDSANDDDTETIRVDEDSEQSDVDKNRPDIDAPLVDSDSLLVDEMQDQDEDNAEVPDTPAVMRFPFLVGADVRPLITLTGVPIAGYGGVDRRKTFPSKEGYSNQFRPGTGYHDAIRVKSIVVQMKDEPSQKLAFVSIDTIGITNSIINTVVFNLKENGLQRENMVFSAIHTHSGPGALTEKKFWQFAAVDDFSQEVYDHVIANIVASIKAADTAKVPAKYGVDTGTETGVSRNRRDTNVPINQEFALFKFETIDDKPLALIYNFAQHATTLGMSNLEFTADNVGYTERSLEAKLPGVVAMFISGAAGDVGPREDTTVGFASAEIVGEKLSSSIADIWKTTKTEDTISFHAETIYKELPQLAINYSACDDTLAMILKANPLPLDSTFAETIGEFMAIKINDTAILTVPGEPTSTIGFLVQEKMRIRGFNQIFLFTLANGYVGYIVTPEEYDDGGYESCATLHGRETGVFMESTMMDVGRLIEP
ncbi:neutral/alkaline non-lysosomal ceramidase N-terminal domain-containing protein [bacterium]|nr:neutral/alkaline non-lysosomal ceramidase N-terminal domain-containing protein [bacterium]